MKTLIESEALRTKSSKPYIAKNTKSVKKLEELSGDSDRHVRRNIVDNPNCSVRILEKLSSDSDWYVRYCVALNDYCPIEILEKLSNDSDPGIQYVANEKLYRIKSFAHKTS